MNKSEMQSVKFQGQVWGNTWQSLIEKKEFPELNEYDFMWNKAMIKEVKKAVDFTKGNKLLECGCGNGIFGLEITNEFPHLELVLSDITQSSLEYSKQLLHQCVELRRSENFNVIKPIYKMENMFNLTHADNTFDYVINGGTIEHYEMDQSQKLIREMYRVLKPEGFIIIIVPNLRNIELRIYKLKLWIKKATKGRLFGGMFLFGASDERNISLNKFKKITRSEFGQRILYYKLPIAYPSWVKRNNNSWFVVFEKILVFCGFHWANIFIIQKHEA